MMLQGRRLTKQRRSLGFGIREELRFLKLPSAWLKADIRFRG
jgi:hypothetical protein